MLLERPERLARAADRLVQRRTSAMHKLKLCCFIPHFGAGGAEMHLLRLLNHLDRSQFDPALIVARRGGSYEPGLREDVPIRACGWGSLPSSTLRMQSTIPGLRRLLKTEQPDVLLAFLDHTVAAAAKALPTNSRRPFLIAGIQNNLRAALDHLPRWSRSWLRSDILSGYAQADHIIALSSGVAETLIEYLPAIRERVSVVSNAGYDRSVESLACEEPSIPIPKGPWFLGCGRLTPQKDFPTLLNAFARIKEETGAELWILGEGGERRKLERQIADLALQDRVRLPGFMRNPFAFMSHASTFVLSSRWEGFGNVLTEAMACGTPVISTDCPHGPGEILEGGRWGELVPVGNVAALAEAMRRSLLEASVFQVRAAAARQWVVRFEASRIAWQYESVIQSAFHVKS